MIPEKGTERDHDTKRAMVTETAILTDLMAAMTNSAMTFMDQYGDRFDLETNFRIEANGGEKEWVLDPDQPYQMKEKQKTRGLKNLWAAIKSNFVDLKRIKSKSGSEWTSDIWKYRQISIGARGKPKLFHPAIIMSLLYLKELEERVDMTTDCDLTEASETPASTPSATSSAITLSTSKGGGASKPMDMEQLRLNADAEMKEGFKSAITISEQEFRLKERAQSKEFTLKGLLFQVETISKLFAADPEKAMTLLQPLFQKIEDLTALDKPSFRSTENEKSVSTETKEGGRKRKTQGKSKGEKGPKLMKPPKKSKPTVIDSGVLGDISHSEDDEEEDRAEEEDADEDSTDA